MKPTAFTILLFTLTCTTLLARKEPTSSLQKGKQIFFDFRLEQPYDSGQVPAKTQRTVFSKVFKKYLTDSLRCNANFDSRNGTDPLKAARDAGQIVPAIADVATGSFTAAGQAQTLYVISVSECNASHADNFGTKRVAIFSGQQLVLDADIDFRSSVVLKSDLDGDGVNELLMTSADMSQGTLTEMAILVSFKGTKVNVIEDFGTVTLDSCASGLPGSSDKASVISISDVIPGGMPKFQTDNYSSSCRGAKRWKFLSSGKMPD
jgi:hypothetical protein